jgi:salicylate hydroxylase
METLFDLAGEQRGKVVHRAALLAELLKPINSKVKHTNKKVTKIEDAPSKQVTIHFSDASTHTADAVIGADGVRGFVRGYVLGANHPAVPAKPAGLWDCRALLPMAKAKELLGEEYFSEDRQYGFVGDGGFFMHDVLDNGETVQCVFSIPTDESWGENEWTRNVGREGLEKAVENWTDTPLKKGIVEAMLQNPDLKAFVQNHHAVDAPTYAKGRVCIMGDAAHCATPWQGSGAGMAIEDAMVLEALLGAVETPAQLANAFQAYSDARIERTQRVVHSSIGTAQILVGRGEGIGLDVGRMREMLPPRWGFIYGLDLGAHKREAVERLGGK